MGAPRNNERVRQGDPLLEVGDLRFAAAGEIGGDDLEVLPQGIVLRRVRSQFGANREELALQPQDDRVPPAIGDERARDAEGRDGFIDVAVSLRTRIGLWYPAAVQQTRFSAISSPGDDALAGDGGCPTQRRGLTLPATSAARSCDVS